MLTSDPRTPRRPPCARQGFTLAELVVAVGVGGVAFGAFALVVAQQERTHAELARRVRAHSQAREGLTALVTELRAVSPLAGDIPAGEARDSSIEFRTAVGNAVVCDLADNVAGLALASFVTPPEPGDTAWAYVGEDAPSAWTPLALVGVRTDRVPTCDLPATVSGLIDGRRAGRPRYSLELSEVMPRLIQPGTPLRITRRVRYSLYRAPDGRWYLGRREWSQARDRFETIQPVAGPYQPYASEASQTSGLELRYVDRGGVQVTSGSPDSDRIAQLIVVLRTPPPPGDSQLRGRRDMIAAALAVRSPP